MCLCVLAYLLFLFLFEFPGVYSECFIDSEPSLTSECLVYFMFCILVLLQCYPSLVSFMSSPSWLPVWLVLAFPVSFHMFTSSLCVFLHDYLMFVTCVSLSVPPCCVYLNPRAHFVSCQIFCVCLCCAVLGFHVFSSCFLVSFLCSIVYLDSSWVFVFCILLEITLRLISLPTLSALGLKQGQSLDVWEETFVLGAELISPFHTGSDDRHQLFAPGFALIVWLCAS